jgi:hypothetical protein
MPPRTGPPNGLLRCAPVPAHAFELREDGSVAPNGAMQAEELEAQPRLEAAPAVAPSPLRLAYRDDPSGNGFSNVSCG